MRATTEADWSGVVRLVLLETPYDEAEILRAAAIARRGKIATCSTPAEFLETARFCAGGGLHFAGYLATLEEFAVDGAPREIGRRWRRDRREGLAVGILIGVGVMLSLAVAAGLVLLFLDVVGVR